MFSSQPSYKKYGGVWFSDKVRKTTTMLERKELSKKVKAHPDFKMQYPSEAIAREVAKKMSRELGFELEAYEFSYL